MKLMFYAIFLFHDSASSEIYTLSLHDALPICLTIPTRPDLVGPASRCRASLGRPRAVGRRRRTRAGAGRSEEHTSELQSRRDLVCRLLLEKKKRKSANGGYTLQT